MSRRKKTLYPGVFYRESKRIGGKGIEKVYYLVFKKDGKVYEEKAGRQYADDMTPARAAHIRAERIEGKRMSRKEIRKREQALKDAEAQKWTIDRLWYEYKKSNPNLKGWRTYESAYKLHVSPNFGTKEPKNILPLDIKRIENKLLKIRTPQTVFHVLELLRRIINFGVNSRLCQGLDFKIKMPKVDNIKTEDLTAHELERLMQAIADDFDQQAGTLMKLVLFTGMRRSELFRLRWKHINFEKRFIQIVDGKGGKDEIIPLNESGKELLEEYKKLNPDNSLYVFPGRGGRQRTTIARQVNRIKERAGLPKDFRSLHGLRHVYASMLASSGKVDLYTLQKLLTHKDPKMTMRYSHLRDEALQKAANLAGNIIADVIRNTPETEDLKLFKK
jgi:integrase